MWPSRPFGPTSPGGGFPPGDIVERMVRCYQAHPLAYQHLRDTNVLMPYVMPELEERGVLESAVRVYLLLTHLAQDRTLERLLELVQSGSIRQETRAEFDQIVTMLQELTRPCLELSVFWKSVPKEEL